MSEYRKLSSAFEKLLQHEDREEWFACFVGPVEIHVPPEVRDKLVRDMAEKMETRLMELARVLGFVYVRQNVSPT